MTRVDIWRIPLTQKPEIVERLDSVLDEAERGQARRLRIPSAGQDFIVGRGALRLILARCLRQQPQQVALRFNRHGKPEALGSAAQPVFFNMSHAGRLAVCAVANRPVGVDLESVEKERSLERLRRCFSSWEQEELSRVPAPLRSRALLSCWVRKEAYLKAKGVGLDYPLDSFDVSWSSPGPAALLANRREPEDVSRWSMAPLLLPPDYLGAVVAEGGPIEIRAQRIEDVI